MKKYLFVFIVLISFSCTNKRVGGRQELLNKIDSLERELKNSYKPGFGELMGSIQTHHSKLWFAGINENWKLAEFEIHEINELLEDLHVFQVDRKETEFLSMMSPDIAKIQKVIKTENIDLFKKEYSQLTKTCNGCHLETKYEYIKVSIPKSNQFSNQEY